MRSTRPIDGTGREQIYFVRMLSVRIRTVPRERECLEMRLESAEEYNRVMLLKIWVSASQTSREIRNVGYVYREGGLVRLGPPVVDDPQFHPTGTLRTTRGPPAYFPAQ